MNGNDIIDAKITTVVVRLIVFKFFKLQAIIEEITQPNAAIITANLGIIKNRFPLNTKIIFSENQKTLFQFKTEDNSQ